MSDCTNGPHTSPNGLDMEIQCDTNSTAAMLLPEGVEFETWMECADECSQFYGGICYAVSYDPETKLCYFRGNGTQEDTAAEPSTSSAPNVHYATMDETQFESEDMECPYPDGSVQRAQNGVPFEIFCYHAFNQDDIDFENKAAKRLHTETFEECLEECSTSEPRCMGILWNGGNVNGYPNCYPKFSNDENKISPDRISHSAIVPDLEINESCDDGSQYTADDKTFDVTCEQTGSGDELAVFYEPDIEGCMGRCAGFEGNATVDACGAIIYEAEQVQNCHLLASISDLAPSRKKSIAVINSDARPADSESENTTPQDSSRGGEDSAIEVTPSQGSAKGSKTPAIVGGVLGSVFAVALILSALWFWKRRQKQKGGARVELDASTGDRSQSPATTALPAMTQSTGRSPASAVGSDPFRSVSHHTSELDGSERSAAAQYRPYRPGYVGPDSTGEKPWDLVERHELASPADRAMPPELDGTLRKS